MNRRQRSDVQRKPVTRGKAPDDLLFEQHHRQHQSDSQAESRTAGDSIPTTTIQRMQSAPHTLSSHEVLHLQRTVGNSAVARMVNVSQQPHASSTVQRVPNGGKIAAINVTLGLLEAAKIILRVGHGAVMLPLTIIDLLSNFGKLRGDFTTTAEGVNSTTKKSRWEKLKWGFHNILNGETRLVSKLSGERVQVGSVNIGKALRFGPWNVGPWIIWLLNKLIKRLERKKRALGG
ncbi:MAG: hypothetical protein IAE80_04215 [Anaerolinea sp.]|nr:hypothetical protein [Anaerolinea sp.]